MDPQSTFISKIYEIIPFGFQIYHSFKYNGVCLGATIFICFPIIRRSELLILSVWGTTSVSSTAASATAMTASGKTKPKTAMRILILTLITTTETASKASVSEISTIIILVTGKQKYLLSWPGRESNQRPHAYQSNVLPRRYKSWFVLRHDKCVYTILSIKHPAPRKRLLFLGYENKINFLHVMWNETVLLSAFIFMREEETKQSVKRDNRKCEHGVKQRVQTHSPGKFFEQETWETLSIIMIRA